MTACRAGICQSVPRSLYSSLLVGIIALSPTLSHAWSTGPGELVESIEPPEEIADVLTVEPEPRWTSLRRMLAEGGDWASTGEPQRPLSQDERSARNRELREAMRSAYGERPGGVMRSGFPQR